MNVSRPGRRSGGSQKAFLSELEGDILTLIHADPDACLVLQQVDDSEERLVALRPPPIAAEYLGFLQVEERKPLFLSSICKDHRDACDDCNSAHDRRQRDIFLLCSRDLEGSDIDQLFLSCIAYTLIGQSQDS